MYMVSLIKNVRPDLNALIWCPQAFSGLNSFIHCFFFFFPILKQWQFYGRCFMITIMSAFLSTFFTHCRGNSWMFRVIILKSSLVLSWLLPLITFTCIERPGMHIIVLNGKACIYFAFIQLL